MGIKQLTKLIKDKSSDSITIEQLYNLSGKKVALDASLIIYQCLMNVRGKNGNQFTNENNKVTSHITGIFYKVVNYLSLNIEPIFIFDGKPPEEKNLIIQERQKKAKKAIENMNNTENIEEKNKFQKKSIRLTKEYIDDIKTLLNYMGITYLHIDGEGEAISSELCRIGYVDYVATEDMDSLAFGCPKLIRNCLDKSIKRKDVISIINLDNIKSNLKLNDDQFLELCILCGCDYCSNIPKIGQAKALQIIQKYENIEKFLQENKTYSIPNDYVNKYKTAFDLFNLYKNKLDIEKLPFHKSKYNSDDLKKYLINDCNISEKRVTNALKKIDNSYK